MIKDIRASVATILVIGGLALGVVGVGAGAQGKKKSTLPGYVLEAQTVFVMIDPDAGISVNDPQGNRTAREDVEKALMRWGRLKPVMATSQADLVIVIRKGNTHAVQPTVGGEPNDRPVIVQGTGDTIRIGAQEGRSPDAAEVGGPTGRPGTGGEVGQSEDMFTVYQGGAVGLGERPPLDRPLAWRYAGKNGLKAPEVPAVKEFKKAVDEALKQQQQQQQKQQKQQGQGQAQQQP
jgi:hypothetical protein